MLKGETIKLLDGIATHRIAVAEYSKERLSTHAEKVTEILRDLTICKLGWADGVYKPSSSGPGTGYQQPTEVSLSGSDDVATWQVVCEWSRQAIEHLTYLCNQRELTEEALRMALIPLMSAYVHCSAQLKALA